MEDEELVLVARELVYSVIARAYAEEPDEAFVCALQDSLLTIAVKLFEEAENGCLEKALDRVREPLARKEDGDISALITDLKAEYAHVFIGPGSLSVLPWESSHSSDERSTSFSKVLEVRNAYRKAGFMPVRYRHVQDDFIGLEFDFMLNLARCAVFDFHEGDADAYRKWLCHSLAFLQDHLLGWIGDLAQSYSSDPKNSLYAPVTEMAALFVKRDEQALLALLGDNG